jgi:hypothetical protein
MEPIAAIGKLQQHVSSTLVAASRKGVDISGVIREMNALIDREIRNV